MILLLAGEIKTVLWHLDKVLYVRNNELIKAQGIENTDLLEMTGKA